MQLQTQILILMPTDYHNKTDYDAPISLSRVSSVIKSEKEKYGADHLHFLLPSERIPGSPVDLAGKSSEILRCL